MRGVRALCADRDPDIARKLGADFVNAQGGQQADDGARDPRADGGVGVVLGQFGLGEAVETARHPLHRSIVHQASERAGVDAQFGSFVRAEEALPGEVR